MNANGERLGVFRSALFLLPNRFKIVSKAESRGCFKQPLLSALRGIYYAKI